MKIVRDILLIACFLCAAGVQSFAHAASVGSIGGQPVDMRRIEMQELFERGREEEALAQAAPLIELKDEQTQVYLYGLMLERVNGGFYASAYGISDLLASVPYKDSGNYSLYFSSVEAIENGLFQQAIDNFSSLPESFLKTKAYLLYAKGRLYEGNQKYEKALECYVAANEEDIIPELSGHIKACNAILKQTKYARAVELFNNRQYDEALSLFSEIDPYEDSIAYIDKIEEALRLGDGGQPPVITTSSVSATSVQATWQGFSESGYVVAYSPAANEKSRIAFETADSQALLENLIPGILYKITVRAKGDGAQVFAGEFSTQGASVPPETKLSVLKVDVRRYFLKDAAGGAALNLLVSQGDRLYPLTDNRIPLPGGTLGQSGTGYLVRVLIENLPTRKDAKSKVQFVLKTGDDKYFCDSADISLGNTIYDPINTLLDAYYAENGAWSEGPATVKIYVDGEYLAETTVLLTTSKE